MKDAYGFGKEGRDGIAQAHAILDQIENQLKAMSEDIKASKVAKAA